MMDLMDAYSRMLEHFGPLGWWPADTETEMMIGGILTQNTTWASVEKAIGNLKRENLLTLEAILKSKDSRLKTAIRPAGYFNQKAKKLKIFSEYVLGNYGNVHEFLKSKDLREQLLGIWGIGKETADSIVLYAAHQPRFVVDAYTKRVFSRLGHIPENATYDEIQELFETRLKKDAELFKEYHAQIVELAKTYCKKKPVCGGCPLAGLCKNRLYSSQVKIRN